MQPGEAVSPHALRDSESVRAGLGEPHATLVGATDTVKRPPSAANPLSVGAGEDALERIATAYAIGGDDIDEEPKVGEGVVVVIPHLHPDVIEAERVVDIGPEDGKGVLIPPVLGEALVLVEDDALRARGQDNSHERTRCAGDGRKRAQRGQPTHCHPA